MQRESLRFEAQIDKKGSPAFDTHKNSLRVCHLIEAAGGGSGQVVYDIVANQERHGFDITLIYSPTRADDIFLYNISQLKNVCLVAVPMKRSVGLHDFRSAYHLYKTMTKYGPFDIVHSHSSKAGALARLVRVLLPHAVHIYMPHAFMSMSPHASPIYAFAELLFSYLTHCVIVASQQEKLHAIDLGIPARKIRYVPMGIHQDVPANRLEARKALGFKADDFVVGFVGRLVEQKNPINALNAFALIAKLIPRANLAIIGDGHLKSTMYKIVSESNLTESVRFMGNINARPLMPAFDCLLCTSDYESFGLVFIEALAAGIPIVTTNVGVIGDIQTKNDLIYATEDAQPITLAKNIMRVHSCISAQGSDYFASKAKTIAAEFSVSKMCENISRIYRELLSWEKRFEGDCVRRAARQSTGEIVTEGGRSPTGGTVPAACAFQHYETASGDHEWLDPAIPVAKASMTLAATCFGSDAKPD